MHRSLRWRSALLVCLLAVAGCGVESAPEAVGSPDPAAPDPGAGAPDGTSASRSTGFAVGRLPSGYELLEAGIGEVAVASPRVAATAVVSRPFDVGGGPAAAPDGAHVAIQRGAEGARLVIVSLPPDTVELAEIPDLFALGTEDRGGLIPAADTDDRDVVSFHLGGSTVARRVVATTDADGNLFVVQALPGQGDLMAEAELVAVALSIGAVDDAVWEASASGDAAGSEPTASDGAAEITRSGGEAGDPDAWLLETADDVDGTDLGRQASPCLRLALGRVACAEVRFTGPDHVVSIAAVATMTAAGAPSGRPFLVVTARGPARSVKLTVGPTSTGADLLPVPGTDDLVAGVVTLGDVPSFDGLATAEFSCDPARTTASTTTVFSYVGVPRLDLLDAADQPIGCLAP